jgi:hypothetical protein
MADAASDSSGQGSRIINDRLAIELSCDHGDGVARFALAAKPA